MTTVPNPEPLRIALWHAVECGCDECWRTAIDAIRDDRLRGAVDQARTSSRRSTT
jgi:hypothetical protein